MENRLITRQKRSEARGWGQHALNAVRPCRGSVALDLPWVELSSAYEQGSAASGYHGTVGQVVQGTGERVNALCAPLKPFPVKDTVKFRCLGRIDLIASCPGRTKGLSAGPLTVAAGSVPCRQCCGLVEKEELRPAMGRHDLAAYIFELTHANDPGRVTPALAQQRPCRRIMDDPAIAHQQPTLGYRNDFSKRRHTIL